MSHDELPPQQDENQIIAERRAKLNAMRKHGNAFPNDFQREHLGADLHAAYQDKSKEELEQSQVPSAWRAA